MADLKAIKLELTEAEWRAVYAALGQYVENTREEAETFPEQAELAGDLAAAEAVLGRFDTRLAAAVEAAEGRDLDAKIVAGLQPDATADEIRAGVSAAIAKYAGTETDEQLDVELLRDRWAGPR